MSPDDAQMGAAPTSTRSEMTRIALLAAFATSIALLSALSQETVSPTLAPSPDMSPSSPPAASATPSASPTPTAVVRNVRISFVPPPLDGTISLGIYDSAGHLVRVLHQQASVDVFTVGADGLMTKWDGKDDHGQEQPGGKYHARGYTVGALRTENLGVDTTAASPTASQKVAVKLVSNPLEKDERSTVELTVGFDASGSFLRTADDLPLYIISRRTDVTGIAIAQADEKSADIWQTSGAGTEHFRISRLDQMMAFDCGSFDLK